MHISSSGVRRDRLAFVVIAVALLLVGTFAPKAGADHPLDYSISFVSSTYDPIADATTFTWVLVGPTGGVSHTVIDTCLGDTALSSGGSLGPSVGYTSSDPTTGASGYKWESGNDLPTGATFTLTFDGAVADTGTAAWTNKKGTHREDPLADQESGTAGGPSCEVTPDPTPTPTPTTTPDPDPTPTPTPTPDPDPTPTPTPTEPVEGQGDPDPTPTPTQPVGDLGDPDVPPVDTPPVDTPPVVTPPVDPPVGTPPGFPPPTVIVPPAITPPPVVDGRTDTAEPEDQVLGTRFDRAVPSGPSVQAAPGTLPVTGFPLSVVILWAGASLGVGLSLLRVSRKRGDHSL